MPRPRILMLTERFAPDLGGVARSSARIAGALQRTGADVDVVAWTRTLPAGEAVTLAAGDEAPEAAGVRLHRLGRFSSLDLSQQHTLNFLDWLHGRRQFDAVWGHYLVPAGFTGVWFAESNGLPSTVSARGNDVDRLVFPPGDFARLEWTLRRASVITAVSEDLANKIRVLLGGEAEVSVVHNVVDADTFAPGDPDPALREELGILPAETVLGFCGELRHKKGLPFLLSALTEVRAKRPACLLVIGDVRPREQAHLATYAAQHPEDAARILVTGHVESSSEVARHLRLVDLLLQPSLWDGLPNALLEAMACGLPCLASDAGGTPEAAAHERTAFLVPRTHLHRLGEAALEVLALPAEKRREIGAAARADVVARFGADQEEAALRGVLSALVPSISE